jgi:hypothetical protein
MKKMIVLWMALTAQVFTIASCDADMPERLVASGTYRIADAFYGDTEQGPAWYYVGREDAGEWKDLTFYPDYGDNWQFSSNPEGDGIYYSIYDWEGICIGVGNANSKKYTIAVGFKAPLAGTITIPNFDVEAFDEGGEDRESDPSGSVKVIIWKGTEELKNTTVSEHEATVEGVTNVLVEAGDFIYIGVDPLECTSTTGVEITNLSLEYNVE